MTFPSGFKQKYAHRELERRFLARRVPDGPVLRSVLIVDRYIPDTGIRLRRTNEIAPDPRSTVHKLTQKIPDETGGPGWMTTLYLSPAEYEALEVVPANVLTKTRHRIAPVGVDVFSGDLAGLVLAEVEFETDESAFSVPPWATAEVTGDIRFTGGRLVQTRRAEMSALLREFGIDLEGGVVDDPH